MWIWAALLLLPTVLLSARHLFTVFRLPTIDPRIPSIVASLTLGATSTLQFRLRCGQKLLLGFLIAFLSVLADCVLAPFLEGERILPRGDEVAVTLRTIASFLSGRLAGYLVGSLLVDTLDPRLGVAGSNLGQIYLDHGRYSEAERAFRQASRLGAEAGHLLIRGKRTQRFERRPPWTRAQPSTRPGKPSPFRM